MKKFMLLIAFCTLAVQSQTLGYNALHGPINNPDRGFFFQADSWDTGWPFNYLPLEEEEDLQPTEIAADISLVRRIVRLDAYNFANSTIDQDFIDLLEADFVYLRSRNMKCVLRFSYWNGGTGDTEPTVATVLSHIAQLTDVCQDYEGVISSIEAGFIGRWGEWHTSTHFGLNNDNLTAQNVADRTSVANAVFGMTDTRMVAFRKPQFMRFIAPSLKPLKMKPYYTNSLFARTAAHNDAFLHEEDDDGTYDLPSGPDRDYLNVKSRNTFTGGESNEVFEDWATCDPDANNILEMGAIEQMEAYHWNHMHSTYHPDVLAQWVDELCFMQINNRLGYRFRMMSSNINTTTNVLTVSMVNEGFANVFNARRVFLVLENTSTNLLYRVNLSGPIDSSVTPAEGYTTDVRAWNAGFGFNLFRRLTGLVTTGASPGVPVGTAVPVGGTYNLYIEVQDPSFVPNDVDYSIRFPNTNLAGTIDVWDAARGFNRLLRTVTINQNSILVVAKPAGDPVSTFEVSASRNPFSDSFDLNVDTSDKQEVVTIKIFDMVGKLVGQQSVDAKDAETITLGGELATGVYNVVVTQGQERKALRVFKQ
ncbi:DUF4832 domain-containing protein [Flavobacterium sp.]|uniref:DUF4832 domain-containing protein n=1 Tax=Flavobacterium sp. TaxID=239 RepID=UPI0039E6860B